MYNDERVLILAAGNRRAHIISHETVATDRKHTIKSIKFIEPVFDGLLMFVHFTILDFF